MSIIKNFFKKVFKEKNTNNFFTLNELTIELDKELSKKRKELEFENAKKMAEIRFLHSRIITLVKDIQNKELEGKENQRFNKAALTAKSQIELQLLRVLDKTNPSERARSLEDSRAYVEETISILMKEIMHFRKNIVYTSVYLKDEMKNLGENLQELLKNLQELKKAFDENGEYFELEKIKAKIPKIKKLEIELIEEREKIDQINELIKQKKLDLSKHEEKINEFSNGKETIKLQQLEKEKQEILNEKQSLKIELSSLLSSIDKPLQRFNQLVDSGRWKLPREKKFLLEGFITNPIIALKSDPKGAEFKKILLEIIQAIEEGKIELKDKEKEKKLESLNEIISFDFFEKIFWKLNEIQIKQVEIEKTITSCSVFETKNKLENKSNEINKKISELIFEKRELELKEKEKNDLLNQQRNEINDFSSKVLGKTIMIKDGE